LLLDPMLLQGFWWEAGLA